MADELEKGLTTLELTVRARKCLILRGGIKSIKALLGKTSEDLLEIKGFGRTSLRQVKDKLAKHGWALKDDSLA